MKDINWFKPDQGQLTSLLNIMLFREALGPNGDNNITYQLLEQEQEPSLILEFAVAFGVTSIEEFNKALDHLSPIITKPHLCLMIDVDGAQEAMQGSPLVPIYKNQLPTSANPPRPTGDKKTGKPKTTIDYQDERKD